ncbi:lipoprotein-releasing ABC transporter permease subunit [Thalassotalea sp. 1_MG-2023]|uniref:lipoprotein-releasing ABC transporter permease subunit n=1 Tax=Thalassotalea sp. 1_MG-2023 TaxID=3062680 RepID=UPI0026E47E57|nr:lipoprotein-releasing ABC transporter permease subunit [Thalassotalea sp. 1_MG-2023]MDO6427601.1 lipoprotein-releasing ABC transporter permease subunit [Thalassotalea sp. 1_MG-2023]
MFQPVSFFIGLRYSRSRQRSGFVSFITFFSIVGILLGVSALITVVSVMNGFEGELKKRILGIVPHVLVSENSQPMKNWRNLQTNLSTFEHVTNVTPIIETEALILSNKTLRGVLLQGIEPSEETNNIVFNHMIAGQLEYLTNQKYSVILGQSLAQKLSVSMGDTIRVVVPEKTLFTPMGRIPVQRTFTISGIFNMRSQVDDWVIYIHRRDASKLLRYPADSISHLRLYLDDAFAADSLVEANQNDFSQYQFSTWRSTQGTLFSAVSMEKNMMWLMLSLIIAVAAFNIVSALVMVVIDKQGEIAILQTFGMDRSGIIKIFMAQGLINGVWGVMLGTICGVILTLNLNNLITYFNINMFGSGFSQSLPINMQLSDIFMISSTALVMSFIATLYPAYRASLTQPAEVLRNE